MELEHAIRTRLDRAPTLAVASTVCEGDAVQRGEELLAGAVAAYLVLLGAHAAASARARAGFGVCSRPAAMLYFRK
jgi:hypothetical protein